MDSRPWQNKRTGATIQVPRGIDPGFAENVGRHRPGRDASDRLIAKIDAAPEDLPVIGTPWESPEFAAHLAGAADDDRASWPVAILAARALRAVRGASRTVRLSKASAAKQGAVHPDVTPADYARLQRILDAGSVSVDRRDKRALVGMIAPGGPLRTENDARWARNLHRQSSSIHSPPRQAPPTQRRGSRKLAPGGPLPPSRGRSRGKRKKVARTQPFLYTI